jgi:hypothetical protein
MLIDAGGSPAIVAARDAAMPVAVATRRSLRKSDIIGLAVAEVIMISITATTRCRARGSLPGG